MVNALEPLICEECHEGFVEILDKPTKAAEQEGFQKIDELDEEKKKANEEYRIVFDRTQPHARVDIYNRDTSNIHGAISPREHERRKKQRQEEERKAKQQQEERKRQERQQ